MKIINVNIPKNYIPNNGLEDINMARLDRIVLIAGPNGSGKTRLLKKIHTIFPDCPDEKFMIESGKSKEASESQILKNTEQLELINSKAPENGMHTAGARSQAPHIMQVIEHHKHIVRRHEDLKNKQRLLFDVCEKNNSIIYFVPKKIDLTDNRGLSEGDLEAREKGADSIGIDKMYDYALPRIQRIVTKYIIATHQDIPLDDKEKTEAIQKHDKLQSIISDLLGERIGYNRTGSITFHGMPLAGPQLSDGQKLLLQLANAIDAQSGQLDGSILFLDEPECHLHPSAIIEVIELLLLKNPNGQLWIATHSVSIIAHFMGRGSLWYMENGRLAREGKVQEMVLKGLLGDEDAIARQREFLDEPDRNAFIHYAVQCLLPPVAVMTGSDDPQMLQIQNAINAICPPGGMKILDFGAGKGRLLSNISENSENVQSIIPEYIALDLSEKDAGQCKSTIEKNYGTSVGKYFNSFEKLFETHNPQSFHVVVMCNVLHEISPRKWMGIFGDGGYICRVLSAGGYLLLVEDQQIRAGELAHEYGFIVLDTGSLKELFNVSGGDSEIVSSNERGGRLKAHLIPRSFVARCDIPSIQRSLRAHTNHAKNEISRLRESRDPKDGRLFAFWINQFANASMSIDSIG